MAIQTLTLVKGVVTSINSVLGIPIGTEMDIVNESSLYNIYIQESLTQPTADTNDKRSITQRDWPESTAYVRDSSLEVWVYTPHGTANITVQVL